LTDAPTADAMSDDPTPDDPSAEWLDYGRWLFAQACDFKIGATRMDQIPSSDVPEVAFAGRSNVGKSSLINALTGRNTLARTSHTPGRTQQINFFLLGERLSLVDLPGYGYAKASKAKVAAWNRLIRDYLRGRPNLRRVCVLIDARHGLKPPDVEVMAMLDEAAVSYQIVLTKTDKTKAAALAQTLDALRGDLARHVACHPYVETTSAHKKTGIAELRAGLAELTGEGPAR
jgi:GTP-binding protein